MIKSNKIILIILIFIIILVTILSNKMIISAEINSDKINYMERIRLQAKVECLQNSQCPAGYECLNNICSNIDKNNCDDISLSTPTRRLTMGMPINSYKRIITDQILPYLLSGGEFVEIIDNNTNEYFYEQYIIVGKNKLERENSNYIIKAKGDEPVYTLKVVFSNSIDFSNENIQRQTLRILDKEYIIGEDSTNDVIYLISDKNKVILEDGKNLKEGFLFPKQIEDINVKISKDFNNKVLDFEIKFYMKDKSNIKLRERYTDSAFNSLYLSFNSLDENGFANVRIGGRCV